MSKAEFSEILTSCMAIENMAADVYQKIAEQSDDEDSAQFWRGIVVDERRHVTYWQRLAEMQTRKKISVALAQPSQVLHELQEMQRNVQTLLEKVPQITGTTAMIFLACRLESLMLNPSFVMLFRLLGKDGDTPVPEEDYTEHIAKFQRFFTRHGERVPGLQVVGEMLVAKWKQSIQIADQVEEIGTLQGLLPMCAGCKKIRDDEGFWNHVESYLQRELDVQFSHSLCPDCLKRLYPDYTPGESTS